MGLMRIILVSALWGCLVLVDFICCCSQESGNTAAKALRDGVSGRGRHRLQLLFPLLLRISTRLSTLVPTALMGLLGIILFVIFSKKAFIVSLFALFLILSDKFKTKNDHFQPINVYPDYNDEEHIHYYHDGPPKYKAHYYWKNHPYGGKYKKNIKRTGPNYPKTPNFIPLYDNFEPFRPISRF